MAQTITIILPDSFILPLQRAARATRQPMEKLLVNALQASLPPLESLPLNIRKELEKLELLNDRALREVIKESAARSLETKLSNLLSKHQNNELSTTDRMRLTTLQTEADLLMLRKARAAVLLRFRGKRVPTLAEIEKAKGNR